MLRNARDNPFILTGTVEKMDMLREMHTCGQKANFHLLCLFSTEHDEDRSESKQLQEQVHRHIVMTDLVATQLSSPCMFTP